MSPGKVKERRGKNQKKAPPRMRGNKGINIISVRISRESLMPYLLMVLQK